MPGIDNIPVTVALQGVHDRRFGAGARVQGYPRLRYFLTIREPYKIRSGWSFAGI
jgi:hypothetical protein